VTTVPLYKDSHLVTYRINSIWSKTTVFTLRFNYYGKTTDKTTQTCHTLIQIEAEDYRIWMY